MSRLQKNILIKPIKIDQSNRAISKPDPKKKESTAEPKNANANKMKEENFDDCSSDSSIDSDAGGFNAWDNSELNLRGIDPEEFTDFYGKKLTFLQLFKLRSSFYVKQTLPTQSEIFKGAEKIYRFCCLPLKLDEFLDEDRQCDIIDVNFTQDKNFVRFSRYFEYQVELNSIKYRAEKYDRYNAITKDNENGNSSNRNKNRNSQNNSLVHNLGLSPRKAPKMKNESEMEKTQMNIYQLEEMHRKQKNLMQPIKIENENDSKSPSPNSNTQYKVEKNGERNYSIGGFSTQASNPNSIEIGTRLGKASNPANFSAKPNQNIYTPIRNSAQSSYTSSQASEGSDFRIKLMNSKQEKSDGVLSNHSKLSIQNSNSPTKKGLGLPYSCSQLDLQAVPTNEFNSTMRSTQTRIRNVTAMSDPSKLPQIQQKRDPINFSEAASASPVKKSKVLRQNTMGTQPYVGGNLNTPFQGQSRNSQLINQRAEQFSRTQKRYLSIQSKELKQ